MNKEQLEIEVANLKEMCIYTTDPHLVAKYVLLSNEKAIADILNSFNKGYGISKIETIARDWDKSFLIEIHYSKTESILCNVVDTKDQYIVSIFNRSVEKYDPNIHGNNDNDFFPVPFALKYASKSREAHLSQDDYLKQNEPLAEFKKNRGLDSNRILSHRTNYLTDVGETCHVTLNPPGSDCNPHDWASDWTVDPD